MLLNSWSNLSQTALYWLQVKIEVLAPGSDHLPHLGRSTLETPSRDI